MLVISYVIKAHPCRIFDFQCHSTSCLILHWDTMYRPALEPTKLYIQYVTRTLYKVLSGQSAKFKSFLILWKLRVCGVLPPFLISLVWCWNTETTSSFCSWLSNKKVKQQWNLFSNLGYIYCPHILFVMLQNYCKFG